MMVGIVENETEKLGDLSIELWNQQISQKVVLQIEDKLQRIQIHANQR